MSDCDGPPPAGDVKNSPTAKQVPALGQETPWKMLRVLPGLGLATIDHAVPFQRSTRVSVGRRKGPRVSSASEPTAKQLVAVAHETLSRVLLLVLTWALGARFGLGTIDHFEPFQRSMSVLRLEPLA